MAGLTVLAEKVHKQETISLADKVHKQGVCGDIAQLGYMHPYISSSETKHCAN